MSARAKASGSTAWPRLPCGPPSATCARLSRGGAGARITSTAPSPTPRRRGASSRGALSCDSRKACRARLLPCALEAAREPFVKSAHTLLHPTRTTHAAAGRRARGGGRRTSSARPEHPGSAPLDSPHPFLPVDRVKALLRGARCGGARLGDAKHLENPLGFLVEQFADDRIGRLTGRLSGLHVEDRRARCAEPDGQLALADARRRPVTRVRVVAGANQGAVPRTPREFQREPRGRNAAAKFACPVAGNHVNGPVPCGLKLVVPGLHVKLRHLPAKVRLTFPRELVHRGRALAEALEHLAPGDQVFEPPLALGGLKGLRRQTRGPREPGGALPYQEHGRGGRHHL